MRAALAVLLVSCLGPVAVASAQEDRVDRAIREAHEAQRLQEQRSAGGAEAWYQTPDGQRWLKTFAGREGQDTSQESSFVYRSHVPHVLNTVPPLIETWNQAVHYCAGMVGGDFSAFAPVEGRVRAYGSERERYEFSACMAGIGRPVGGVR